MPTPDSDPSAPGRALRTARLGDFPHVAQPGVTLVLTTCDADVPSRFAVTAAHKRELLEAVVEYPAGEILAVWTGSYESHVFKVTEDVIAHWLAELSS